MPPEQWPEALHSVLDASRKDGPGRTNLFGTLAHHLPLAQAWLALARVLTHDGALSARDRELVILRTAHRLDCAFVHDRHTGQARHAGLGPDETAATAAPLSAHVWSSDDLSLLQTVDALADHTDVPDDLWERLAGRLHPDQLVEFLLLAGQTATMCMTLRTLRTPPDTPSPTGPPSARACDAVPHQAFDVRIDRERCCSSGQCVGTAPDVFEQNDEDGLVMLRPGHRAATVQGAVRLAAALCPGGAITVTPKP
ncbi:carboxymuconolactone decarboxylase family protein [Streptomyces sp. NBC_01304]|uniref:carboxymuconolactone decarboxylase family protein n=1 Tax=Streptomyces sp. NBC_01304 TaxID=2903818 RepID=UPI002E11BC76|nr:carboxymuconolactone decarboxylase family protein [Streptomyces sp. NBC_01304]